ncbi:MAG: hypothetical protein AMXMBFR64_07060 [Myxococcales bacterium]
MTALPSRFIEPRSPRPYLQLLPPPNDARLMIRGASRTIYDLLAQLPQGQRSRGEIDEQLREARDSWDSE